MTPADRRHHRASPFRLIAPFAGVALLVTCGVLLYERKPETHSPADVEARIVAAALAGGLGQFPRGADRVGPWNLAATERDVLTGDLVDFRLNCDDEILITASRAKVHVSAMDDTFSIEMWDVVYTSVPTDADGEASVRQMDHYLLGPAPYHVDIVPDPTFDGEIEAPAGSPLAQVKGLGDKD